MNKKKSVESKVPTNRFSRLGNYISLGLRIGTNVALRSFLSPGSGQENKTNLVESDMKKIVDTLCHMRGAALKIGQVISIQDNEYISKDVQEIFKRVRQNADSMPFDQINKVLNNELGSGWREKFLNFEEKPFAAASIGQVHRAQSKLDNTPLSVKVQYPNISNSIDSDIDNFMMLLKLANFLPEGLYAKEMMEEARHEMKFEVNYEYEAQNNERYK